jgi:putative redox protein
MEEVEETNVPAKAVHPNLAALDGLYATQCRAFFAALQYQGQGGLERPFQAPGVLCTMHAKMPTKTQSVRQAWSSTMECTINWLPQSGMAFSAETGSGHLLMMDGAPDGGGRNLAPRPLETVLAGTGGCTAYDVVLILQRGRHDVRGCQVAVTSERAATDPKVFTKIHMHFIVSGPTLTEAAVERAVRMSHEKYCSASIMLAKTAEITTSFEVKT